MLRCSILGLGLLVSASACAPAPLAMPATRASEVLELFAAGAAPVDVCTPQGRALLRGAVRAYSAEMARAGVAWPALPAGDADQVRSVDVNVLIAFTAGFVEASDFAGPTARIARRLPLPEWRGLPNLRQAARVACTEVAELQQAAVHFVLETQRYRGLAEREGIRVDGASARLGGQARRLESAQVAMQSAALMVESRVEAAGRDS